MNELLRWFLIIASIIFVSTAFVLIVFPVDVYERARESRRLRDSFKGLFAQTVNSMYHIKRDGFNAEPKYWWHMLWFNTATSAGVSIGITTGLFIIIGVLMTILILIAFFIALGSLGSSK